MRRIKVVALALLLAAVGACVHPPVSLQTPQAKIAYTADQAVQRVNELQNAAIQANATGAISTETTRLLVSFAVAADTTLKTMPAGWQQTVTVLWSQTKTQLPVITNPAVAAAVGSVDVVLASLGGQ